MLDDICEQPAALKRLLRAPDARRAADLLSRKRPRLVRLVAHGSSDNAAVYAGYALANELGLACVRASVTSLLSYRATEDLRKDAVIAISQSGRTPDVVEYVHAARGHGALTLAVTNDVDSPLAEEAEFTVPLHAGPEHAIPATKTFLNQVAAFALLVAEATGAAELRSELERLPALVEEQIRGSELQAKEIAGRLARAGRMMVLGLGYELATAREIALKITEAALVPAEHMSVREVLHGPIAALEPDSSVLVLASHGPVLADVQRTCKAIATSGVRAIAIGNATSEVECAERLVVAPVPEILGPILSVIPGQLIAYHTALARGLDPSNPRGLTKVVLAA